MTALFQTIGNDVLVAGRLGLRTNLHRPETELRATAADQPLLTGTIDAAIAANNQLYTRYNRYYGGAGALAVIGTIFWAAGLGEMVNNKYAVSGGFFSWMAVFYALSYYCVRQHRQARAALSFNRSERAASMDRREELQAQAYVV